MTALHDIDELLPHLRLLGTAELHVRGQVLRNFGGRGSALLLARLALAPRQAHPRETLIDQLWPDADIDAGRNRLRNALSVLRTALAEAGCEQVVLADRDSLRLAPGALVCDVHHFEEAVQRHQWLDARHIYAGELLPGHYEEWGDEERLVQVMRGQGGGVDPDLRRTSSSRGGPNLTHSGRPPVKGVARWWSDRGRRPIGRRPAGIRSPCRPCRRRRRAWPERPSPACRR